MSVYDIVRFENLIVLECYNKNYHSTFGFLQDNMALYLLTVEVCYNIQE